ncbi:MAG: urease accessory protein UreF [Gammaproteobacteria bacterium]|nr:urease accessory protein UreF [Gammaproteobacteria bacterium]
MPEIAPDNVHNIDLRRMRLFQINSALLPVGGFSYSQGLETAIDQQWVHNPESGANWIQATAKHSLLYNDLALLKRLHHAFSTANNEAVEYWNQLSVAIRETRELAAEDKDTAQSFKRVLLSLNSKFTEQLQTIRPISYVTAYAAYGVEHQLLINECLASFIWSWLENQIQVLLKLLPMGQAAGQQLMFRLSEDLIELIHDAHEIEDDQIGFSLPGVVHASAKHEQQYSRLFRS